MLKTHIDRYPDSNHKNFQTASPNFGYYSVMLKLAPCGVITMKSELKMNTTWLIVNEIFFMLH